MRNFQATLAFLFCAALFAASTGAQDSHVVDDAALLKAIGKRVSEDDAHREAIRLLLQRPEVREIAGRAGLDLGRLDAAVGTLEGSELQHIASQARQINSRLAGGQSKITLSTTTIIIGLLILILIIVAVG